MPLPLDALERLRPRPGEIYVERDEQPERYGDLVLLPESYRTKVQSAVGTVRALGPGVFVLRAGDRVLISAGVARKLVFGEHNERILHVCYAAEVYALLLEDEKRIEEIGEAAEGRYPFVSDRARYAEERVADEGTEHPGR